jgi:uncharacterized repeat protein (TIGR01451 family)
MHQFWKILSLAVALICAQQASALQTDLVGLDKNDSTNWGPNSAWMGQNLQNWKELDYIPVRIEVTGDAVVNHFLMFTFDHQFGFQNLYFISNSPNVLFETAPVLNAPFGAPEWSYDLHLTKTDDQIGYVYFYARLAAGAHVNNGSSLHLDGATFEPLQIHKPGAAAGNPDLAIFKTGPASAAPGSVITYTLIYTNRSGAEITGASGVQVSDELPPLLTYVPGSASGGGTLAGNMITWDVMNLPVGAGGTFTFQAIVSSNAVNGDKITNSAMVMSAENDANMADNFATFVTMVTSTPVIITCSTNKTVELGSAWNFDPPTVSGGCEPPLSLEVLSTVTNSILGACTNSHTATRTWRASDTCGNSAECSQTVTVVDTTAPVISCSPNKIVELGSAWTFDAPTATDVGGGAVTITIVDTVTNRTEANCGATFSATRTWQATDACGAVAQCSQTVTVEDHTGPSILCAGDKTVELGSAWNFDPPTATDPSSVTITIVGTITNKTEANCGGTFSATRTWLATDACNNSSQCSQTVTVIDTTGPSISCAANKTVEVGSAWSFDLPTVTDLSGTNISVIIVSTTTNAIGGACGNSFSVTRVWRATDACGNPAQCSQTVNVVDTAPPIVNCSTNKTVQPGTPWTFDPPTAADMGGNVTITIVSTTTNVSETCGMDFTATRVWAISDMCSNSVQCVQVVSVQNDGTGPTVSIVMPTNNTTYLAPATFTVVAEPGVSNRIASITFLMNSTALGTVTNSPYFVVVTNLPAGDYAFRAVATDVCGLITTSSVVNVHVISSPPILALGPIVLNRQNGLFEQSVRVTNPTPFPWPNGLRIYISDVDATNRVWNATGTNNGLPYVEKTAFVAAGGSQDFLIQYYVPNPRVTPTSTLTAVPNPAGAESTSVLRLERALPLTNGQFCVEFLSRKDRLYYVQRTEDHLRWSTVGGLIVGTGQRIQQFDGGVGSKRFYRVVCLP